MSESSSLSGDHSALKKSNSHYTPFRAFAGKKDFRTYFLHFSFTFKTRYVIDMEDVGPVSVFVEGDVEKMKVSFPPPN